ncbi:MAG TPA: hypothetical protein VJM34_12205 [Novosphingobium sp.]|nr:hypothetical protein [Novosphingobium sp.]
MVDYFAIAVSHGLLLMMSWRLLFRNDLDDDHAAADPRLSPVGRPRARPVSSAVASLREDDRPQG